MFIISLNYICDLELVDNYLDSHIKFLNEQYEHGTFLASGRKNPRTGGVILAKADNINQITAIIDKDPFKINKIAEYEIIEFIPTRVSEELAFIKGV
jgi:uncharacterized protein YciI